MRVRARRLLVPGLAQGMLMLDRGDGTVEDIDKSMELGAGHPMGPFTLAVRCTLLCLANEGLKIRQHTM